jgi:hypothetical protein
MPAQVTIILIGIFLRICVICGLTHILKDFFAQKNIPVNVDAFSLSCLIQWIWRSRIRNNESIKLYLPSTRMRNLLENWLNGDVLV